MEHYCVRCASILKYCNNSQEKLTTQQGGDLKYQISDSNDESGKVEREKNMKKKYKLIKKSYEEEI